MIERIKKIMQEEGLSQGKFAEEIGITNSRFSHYLSGRNNVTLEMATNILERFRGISSEWLLFGRGEMYKNSSPHPKKQEQHDLFSPIINSPASTENTIINEPAQEIKIHENVSTEKLDYDDIVQPPDEQYLNEEKSLPTKIIEKIIILYADGTFDSYLPNGKKV